MAVRGEPHRSSSYDPTRGIDVGTKHELYVLMRAFAEMGGSILFHSTEIPELVHLCDRVIVLATRPGGGARSPPPTSRSSAIMRAALGGDAAGELAA